MEMKMKVSMDQEGGLTQQVPNDEGGFKAILFILGSDFLGRVAVTGLLPQMILYLTGQYHLDSATGAIAIFVWTGMTNFAPILGGFLSDSYFGRFRVICLGSVASLIGMTMIWLTTIIPELKPADCKNPSLQPCESPTATHLALLVFAFTMVSFGVGCTRSCFLPFCASQLDKKQNTTKNEKLLQSLNKWYYPLVAVSFVAAVTAIAYLQEFKGWEMGFGILVVLMALSSMLLVLGSPVYINQDSNGSLLTELAQVIAAALKNRHLVIPPDASNISYHRQKFSKILSPSEKFRFLNRAAIIKSHEDLNSDGSVSNPWSLCTVEQVEDLKSVMKLIPIWSSGIIFTVTIRQHSLLMMQTNVMNRQIGSLEFQIPPGSMSLFSIITLMISVAIYDGLIAPQLAKLTGRTHAISLMQRMGTGLVLASAAMALASTVEAHRKKMAIQQGFEDNGHAVVKMSAMWLAPQLCLIGIAEAFNVIGQMKFYHSELPERLAGIGAVLFSLGMVVGNFLASLIVVMVKVGSTSGGKVSWLSRNFNRGHRDYYYRVLALLGFVNFVYFLLCCWAHGKEGEGRCLEEEDEWRLLKDEEIFCRSRELAFIL